jgi:xanthine dehydrogenase accessory factor
MLVWRRLSATVAEHGAAALVAVQDTRGSAPREPGAALAVRPDGAFHGTIGGGRLEWEALREARAALAAGRGPALWRDHVLGPDLGQCCGGRVTLRIETFDRRDGDELGWLAEAEEAGGAVEASFGGMGRVARQVLGTSLSRREPGRGEGAQVPGEAEAAVHSPPPPLRGRDSLRRQAGRGAVRRWPGLPRSAVPGP